MQVVDFSQIAIATVMAETKGRTDIELSVDLIRHMILNTLRSYRMKFKGEFGDLVIACDDKNYWRRDIFPPYKGMRKKGRDESGFDWKALFAAMDVIKQELTEYFPYPVVQVPKAEADDVIAVLAEWSQTHDLDETDALFGDADPKPFLVLSADGDFDQLQRFKNVKQYAPTMRKWVKVTGKIEHALREKIITGDKGDGVPNMLSPDDTFVSEPPGRQKPIKTDWLEASKKLSPDVFCTTEAMRRGYDRNRALIDLSLIPQNVKDAIVANFEAQIGTKSRGKLLNFFISRKMKHLIDSIQEF